MRDDDIDLTSDRDVCADAMAETGHGERTPEQVEESLDLHRE